MAEKRTIELEIQDNSKSLKAQYKEAVAELQKMSAQYGETSEQAIKAAKAAADLKDQIGFSKDLVDSFNPDAKFNALSRSIGGVLDGFQAFEGAMGLIGVEGEQIQETLLKVQSAMALSQGIQGVMEAKDSLLQLGTVLKSTAIGQAVLTAATAAYNYVVGASTTALKLFRIALISTGIGALVVGVGLLIANFEKIVDLVKKGITWFTGLNGTMKNILSVIFPVIGLIRLLGTALEELGVIDSEQDKINAKNKENQRKRTEAELKQIEAVRKAREKNFNNEQAAYDREIKLQEALGKSTLELQKAKINASIKYQETKKKELEQDLLAIELGQRMLGNILGTEFQDSIAGYQNKINEIANNIENQKTDLKILDIEAKKPKDTGGSGSSPEKQVKEKIDLTRQRIDKEISLIEDGYEKERRLLEEKAKREKEDLAKSIEGKIYDAKEYAKTQKLIEDNLKKDLKDLNSKYFDGEIKARGFSIEALKNDKIKELEIEVAANEEKARIQKEYDEKEKARIEQLNKDKLKLAKDGLQLVSDLASLFGQQDEKKAKLAFQVDKAAKISSATIAGYEAVLEAYKTGQKSPLTAVFPAYPYIQAGLAGAFAAVNIAKIGKAKFQSSGGGGGSMSPAGAGGGAAPMTANFNTIGSSGINQLAQLQQTPTQAYVVSGEVTSAQALDRNRVQNATL